MDCMHLSHWPCLLPVSVRLLRASGAFFLPMPSSLPVSLWVMDTCKKTLSTQGCSELGDNTGYLLHIFVLMVVDLLGFSSIPSMKNGLVLALVLAGVLTIAIAKATNTKNPSISAFFMISQLVASVTGLLIPNPKTVTPQVGWAFILPCIVSMVEFLACDSFLVQYGGHALYDFFLHLSLLVSLMFGEFSSPFEETAAGLSVNGRTKQ